MREIKFKAWDKKKQEWVANGDSMNLYYSARVNAFMFDNDNYDLNGNIEFYQYTGLKDKNGKEIYEGDICTADWYDYAEPSHGTTGVIEFSEGWMAYWLADYENKTFEELNGHGCYSWDIVVIGNIHDNPELIAQQEYPETLLGLTERR